MNLANRLNRLEKRLRPPDQSAPDAILLAMALTREELTVLRIALERGDCLEDKPEIQDIFRRVAVFKEELDRGRIPQKIAGEL
jgi:hypothetical protein